MPALKIKTVDSLQDYVSSVERLRSGQSGHLWFRGCGRTSHKLVPSLYRHKRRKAIDDILLMEKVSHELFEASISFPKKRAQDKNAATKLLLFEYNGKPVETKKASLDRFTLQAKRESREMVELASRRVLDTLDRMSEIFLPHDPLLRSAGVFLVYYWFVRENDAKQDQYVREFLNAFESSRRENRELAADPTTASSANSELLTFDRFNRSTDDERSHVERHRILARRFKEFLSKSRKSK